MNEVESFRPVVRLTSKPTGTSRIEALDFTKGALVLFMVLYHWLNYFFGLSIDYRYLRFLTPSFIFITGFLIAQVYLTNCRANDPRVSRRLLTRGAKLLLCFLVLNIGRAIILYRSTNPIITNGRSYLSVVWEVCVVGNVLLETSKAVAFYVLIPIGYLLIISGALIPLYRRYAHIYQAVAICLFASVVGLGVTGFRSANLELMTIGMLGVLIGFIPIQGINRFVWHPRLFVLSYLSYLVAITVWNTPFMLVVVGVCLTLWGIYLTGLREDAPARVRRHVILLGKHSLFGYIIQIAILQVLVVALGHIDIRLAVIGVSFVVAFGLTMAAVEVVEWVKRRSTIVDRLYRVAFA